MTFSVISNVGMNQIEHHAAGIHRFPASNQQQARFISAYMEESSGGSPITIPHHMKFIYPRVFLRNAGETAV
jgi:hypothetical protein